MEADDVNEEHLQSRLQGNINCSDTIFSQAMGNENEPETQNHSKEEIDLDSRCCAMSVNSFVGKAVEKLERIEEHVSSRKCLERRRLDPGYQKSRAFFCLSQGLPGNCEKQTRAGGS